MEDFGARDATALAFCRERVLACDVYVGLIGVYRGSEPAGDNRQRSYTELEYDWAAEAGKSRLMYVTPEGFGSSPPAVTPDQAARQRAFRARVMGEEIIDKRFLDGQLATPSDLAAAVATARANVQLRHLLATIAAQERRLAASASELPKRRWWRPWGRTPPTPPPPSPADGPAKPTVEDTLAGLAADADFD